MLPLVCNDAVALLFMFDLSRKSTLTSVKNWYKQARLLNKVPPPPCAFHHPVLVCVDLPVCARPGRRF